MPSYVDAVSRPPKTLTEREQRALLRLTGEHRDGFREHLIFSLALGTGLREHELLALDCGDVYGAGGRTRRRLLLRVFKGCEGKAAGESQEVVLPDAVRSKLDKYRSWKQSNDESTEPSSPLFVSRIGKRLSARMLRHLFHQWQERAGFERTLGFHALRHTACSTLYRLTKDIRVTQRFARHKSILTTAIYAHPSDDDIVKAVQHLPC